MGKGKKIDRAISQAEHLGDCILNPYRFAKLDAVFEQFKDPAYLLLNHKKKSEQVNRALLNCLLAAPLHVFGLMAVVEFIDRVAHEKILINYSLSSFELWLNQFSDLSLEENYKVRATIVGKHVPRDDYQILFPIGMGKMHLGSHFVTAHSSPDLDTTIASFWGWIDSFGARVAEGVHIWNVPGGAPDSSIEVAILFHHVFGQNVFKHLAKTRSNLALSSLELMTQRGVVKRQTDQSSLLIDHERAQKAVILIDEQGYFLGDWRSFDVEGVRQVIMLLSNCLRWFENNLHINFVSLFAKKGLEKGDLSPFLDSVFSLSIKECEPAKEFTDKQKRYIEGFLCKVLFIEKGLDASFSEFSFGMKTLGISEFQACVDHVEALAQSDIFDTHGHLVEDRSKIFHYLERIIALLDRAIQSARLYMEKLEVALNIKMNVFGYLPQVVSYRADVDELKSKMGSYSYLTVTSTDDEGKMVPLGVVRARDLNQPILGTVTLRDFCNRDETKIPSYLEVISVIDHHKMVLNTSSAPVVYISDAQSSNAIVAELAFAINDKYSTNGMTLEEIQAELIQKRDPHSPEGRRIFQRLLKREHAALGAEHHPYHVDPLREFVEYLHFLYAILDDTDLLTKVSHRDIECVGQILNRLKSLKLRKEVEVVSFEDIPRDETFVQKAATRILRCPDMYSLYQKIYLAKEHLVEENFALCASGKKSSFFVDTKLQNGCARVGQTKLFSNNYPSFSKHVPSIRKIFVSRSYEYFTDHREFDLHIYMISTIAGAADLFAGEHGHYKHDDELWIWAPLTEQSIERLKSFLNAFRSSPQIQLVKDQIKVHFQGKEGKELEKIFQESFLPCSHTRDESPKETLAVITYPAGTINSRKAMISPYLPKAIY